MDVTGSVKIGRTNNIERRLKEIQTGAPYPVRLLVFCEGFGHLEKRLHHELSAFNTRPKGGDRQVVEGEWFKGEALQELPVWIYERIPEELLAII